MEKQTAGKAKARKPQDEKPRHYVYQSDDEHAPVILHVRERIASRLRGEGYVTGPYKTWLEAHRKWVSVEQRVKPSAA